MSSIPDFMDLESEASPSRIPVTKVIEFLSIGSQIFAHIVEYRPRYIRTLLKSLQKRSLPQNPGDSFIMYVEWTR
jgi:hypothetical protein